jgi:hypothetical protein
MLPTNRFTRSSYGVNLLLRLMITRAAMNGRVEAGASILEKHLAGRVTDSVYRDFERRLVTKAGAMVIGGSPLDASELATLAGDLARNSALDALLSAGAIPAPLRGRLGVVAAAAVGRTVAEGRPKVVSRLEFDSSALTPAKAVALIVATMELLELGIAEGAELLEAELLKACSASVDGELVSVLTAGTPSSAASTGSFAADLNLAVSGFPDNAAARIVALVAPATARQLATVSDPDGHLLFPDVDAGMGGNAGSIRVVPTGALASPDSDPPNAIVVDARGVAIAATPLQVAISAEASISMIDSPTNASDTPTPTQVTSLWQTNSCGVRAEREFVVELVRANAVHIVEGAHYVGGGAS